jgi:hypothetical protein
MAREPAMRLPEAQGVNVGTLSRLFADTTNSYKHLFFDALLSAFRDSGFTCLSFTVRELAVGMVAKAWYPIRMFRLSLGTRDQVVAVIAAMPEMNDAVIPQHRLRDTISAAMTDHQAIVQYVQYRVLSPFFPDSLRGLDDYLKNGVIRELAEAEFDIAQPLYKFVDQDTIALHPAWAEYLASNYPIVAAWAELHWMRYLQSRNPSVPGITEKAGPPAKRSSLAPQTQYWKDALAALGDEPRCVYSGQALDLDDIHLDHFLPWTFVCHDALWNLAPVVSDVNLSKGNRLPDPAYLPAVVDLHHRALVASRPVLEGREWDRVASAYVGDLRMPEADILDVDALYRAYDQAVRPQLDIARSIGFVGNWRW